MMNDPLWINSESGAPAYAANELRRNMAMLLTQAVGDKFGARAGVHPAGGDAVSLSGTTVTVLHTKAVAYPGLTSTAGPYIGHLLSTTHVLDPADGANPRKDLIVAHLYDDDEDTSGFRTFVSEYIAGLPAASPVEPDVPLNAFRMATIDVPATGTPAPTLTYNAPFTVSSGGVLPVRNDAELPGSSSGLYDGMMRWNRATNELQVHNGGSLWETIASTAPALAPGTVVAIFRRTTAVSLTNTTSGASSTAIPWDFEDLDSLSGHSTLTNPTRYTPTVAGWYTFHASIGFSANTNGVVRGCAWRKNGTTFDANLSRFAVDDIANAFFVAPALSVTLSFNGTTDYIELAGLQDSGASLNTDTGAGSPRFTAVYAGPL